MTMPAKTSSKIGTFLMMAAVLDAGWTLRASAPLHATVATPAIMDLASGPAAARGAWASAASRDAAVVPAFGAPSGAAQGIATNTDPVGKGWG